MHHLFTMKGHTMGWFGKKRKESAAVAVLEPESAPEPAPEPTPEPEPAPSPPPPPPTPLEELTRAHDIICQQSPRLQVEHPTAYAWLTHVNTNLYHARAALSTPYVPPAPAVVPPPTHAPSEPPVQMVVPQPIDPTPGIAPTPLPYHKQPATESQRFTLVKLSGGAEAAEQLVKDRYGMRASVDTLTRGQIGPLIDERKKDPAIRPRMDYAQVPETEPVAQPKPTPERKQPRSGRRHSVGLHGWDEDADSIVDQIEALQRQRVSAEEISKLFNEQQVPHFSGQEWTVARVRHFRKWVVRQKGILELRELLPGVSIPSREWSAQELSDWLDIVRKAQPRELSYRRLARILNDFRLTTFGRGKSWAKDSLRNFHLSHSTWAQEQKASKDNETEQEKQHGLVREAQAEA